MTFLLAHLEIVALAIAAFFVGVFIYTTMAGRRADQRSRHTRW